MNGNKRHGDHRHGNKRLPLCAVMSAASLIVLTAAAQAAPALVAPFDSVNLPPQDADAATLIFSQAYAAASGHQLLALPAPPADSVDAVGPSAPFSPQAACQRAACQVLVTGGITRLGSRLVVAVSEAGADGRVVHSAQATAASLDDLEGVLPRLAQTLVRRTSYDRTRGPETVTQREVYPNDKMRSTSVAGLRSGLVLANVGGERATSVDVAINVRFERGPQFVFFGLGLVLPASAGGGASYGGLNSELGAGFYLGEGDSAPYIAGALIPKLAGASCDRSKCGSRAQGAVDDRSSDNSIVGLGVQLKAGMMLMRTSNTRLFVEAAVDQEVVKLTGYRPQVFRFSLGVTL